MTGTISAINCTNCGAGLEVLGGGRVVTQVCGYCGARLDATDAYAVLSVHAGLKRPETPFKLGMTGQIDGVTFTIIGILGLQEAWDGGVAHWVDHILYSPTHGYAWLTLEDGHILLTRKIRDWPDGSFVTDRDVARAETRPSRFWRGETYVYYATTNWKVDFVEGEFTWRPEVGHRGTSISLMPEGRFSDHMIAYAHSEEREIETTRYFPEAAAAFGVELPRPSKVHALQPYEPAPGKRFYASWFGVLTVISVLLAIIVMEGGGREVLFQGTPDQLPPSLTIPIAVVDRPVGLQFYQDLSQAWAEYEMTIVDPTGQVLAETGRAISYYSGGSGDDAWSEGSRYESLVFQPTVSGDYRLDVALAEASPRAQPAPLRLTLQEGQGASIWTWGAAALFGMATLWTLSSSWRHRMLRWNGSDWVEEDD